MVRRLAPHLGLDPGAVALRVHDADHAGPLGGARAGADADGILMRPSALANPDPALFAHELTHLAQHRNRATAAVTRDSASGVLGRRPSVTEAEAEAAALADATRHGTPLWRPRAVLPDGHLARVSGSTGVMPARPSDAGPGNTPNPGVPSLQPAMAADQTAATLSALTDVVRRTHSADLDRIKAEISSFGEIAPDKRDYVLSLLDQVPFVVGKAMVSTLDSDQRQRLAQLSDRDHQRHPAAAVAVLAALKTDEMDALGDKLAKGKHAALHGVQFGRLEPTALRALYGVLGQLRDSQLAELTGGDRRDYFRGRLAIAPPEGSDADALESAFTNESRQDDRAAEAARRRAEKQKTQKRRQERAAAGKDPATQSQAAAEHELRALEERYRQPGAQQRSVKRKGRHLERFRRLLKQAGGTVLEKNKRQGDFDELQRTPTSTAEKPQTKHVAGGSELPGQELRPGEDPYAQPDFSVWRRHKDGSVERLRVNLKSHNLLRLTKAQARATAKACVEQAIRNSRHLATGDTIVISFAQTPTPDVQEVMKAELFGGSSPKQLGEVRFGTTTHRRQDFKAPAPPPKTKKAPQGPKAAKATKTPKTKTSKTKFAKAPQVTSPPKTTSPTVEPPGAGTTTPTQKPQPLATTTPKPASQTDVHQEPEPTFPRSGAGFDPTATAEAVNAAGRSATPPSTRRSSRSTPTGQSPVQKWSRRYGASTTDPAPQARSPRISPFTARSGRVTSMGDGPAPKEPKDARSQVAPTPAAAPRASGGSTADPTRSPTWTGGQASREGTGKPPITKGEMAGLLTEHEGNVDEVARELDVHRSTVYRWGNELGISPNDFRPHPTAEELADKPRYKPSRDGEYDPKKFRRPEFGEIEGTDQRPVDRVGSDGLRKDPNARVSVFHDPIPKRVAPLAPGTEQQQGHDYERQLRDDLTGGSRLRQSHSAGDKTRHGDVSWYEAKHKVRLSSDDFDQLFRDLHNPDNGHTAVLVIPKLHPDDEPKLAAIAADFEELMKIRPKIAVRETDPPSEGEKPGSGASSTTAATRAEPARGTKAAGRTDSSDAVPAGAERREGVGGDGAGPATATKRMRNAPKSASLPGPVPHAASSGGRRTTAPTSASQSRTKAAVVPADATSVSKVRGGATTSKGSSTSPIVGPGGFGGSYTGGATHAGGATTSYGAHGRTDVTGNYDVGAVGGVGKGPVGVEVTFGKRHHVTPGEVVKVADGVWEVSYTIDDSTSKGAGLTGSVGPVGIGGDLSETTSESHTGAKRFTSKAEAEAFARNPNATVDFDGSATFPLTTAAGALRIPIGEKRGVGDIDTVTKGLSASASAATLSWSKHSSDGHSLSVFRKDECTLQVTTVVTTERGSDWSLATVGFADTKGGSDSNLFEVTYEFDFHSEAAKTAYETFCALRLPPLNATLWSRRELSVQEEHEAINLLGGARTFGGKTWQETVSDTSGQTKNYGGAQTDDESPDWLLGLLGDEEFHSNAQIVRSSHNDRDAGATAEVDVSGESGEHNFNEFAKIFGRGKANADAARASGKWTLTAEVPMEAIQEAEKDWPTLAKTKTKNEKMLIYSRLVKEHGAGMVGGQVGMSSLAWNLELEGDANFPGEAGREQLNELAKNLRAQVATTPAAADAAIHTLDDELATLARRRKQVGDHKNYTDLPDDLRNEQLTIIDGHIAALRSVRNSAIAASMRQSGTQMTEDDFGYGKERDSVAALEGKVAGLARQIQKELAVLSPAIAPNGDPRLRRGPLSREEIETAESTVPGLWVEAEQAARRDVDLAKDVQHARENWRAAGDQLDRLQQVRETERLLNKRVEAMNECLKAIRETAKAVGPVAPEKILWAHEDYWSRLGVFIPENPDSVLSSARGHGVLGQHSRDDTLAVSGHGRIRSWTRGSLAPRRYSVRWSKGMLPRRWAPFPVRKHAPVVPGSGSRRSVRNRMQEMRRCNTCGPGGLVPDPAGRYQGCARPGNSDSRNSLWPSPWPHGE